MNIPELSQIFRKLFNNSTVTHNRKREKRLADLVYTDASRLTLKER